VVERLRGLGAIFVQELHEVPDDATVIFSAHGVPAAVESEAERRGLRVFDATCPLVTKVHMEVARFAREAREVILIGHAGHPEVEGTMGRFDASFGGRIVLVENLDDVARLAISDPARLAFVTQTTLSVDDTADAVKQLLESCDVLVVVGSRASSNSNRLRELADRANVPGFLVDGPDDLRREWFEGRATVGVTAGASAPELLVKQVVERLREWGAQTPAEQHGREEHVVFALPRALRSQ
jgi:4-hydroxy-3-methylbut-2-enyl diphosphate reductase